LEGFASKLEVKTRRGVRSKDFEIGWNFFMETFVALEFNVKFEGMNKYNKQRDYGDGEKFHGKF
jgi:hypothetical protein